jgi:hypothetical protein
MPQLQLPVTTTRTAYVPLGGGLDLLTPPLRLKPGYVSDALNWEQSIAGGYSRIGGYERFNGLAAPSAAVVGVITITMTAPVVAGDVLTGLTSGASATVVSLTDAAPRTVVAYTKLTGAFVLGETVRVGGVAKGTVFFVGATVELPASFDAVQSALAANVYRALITAVPGAGPVRGGFYYGGSVYAFRNNVGNTALALWKSSSTGWVAVPLGTSVSFVAGTSEYTVGETLTQGGVNATVLGVALESGTWAGGTAVGRLMVSTPSGGTFAAGASVGGGAATLVLQLANSLLPNGRVQTDIGNFDGVPKVYGVDGVNRAWQFDGSVFMPIKTNNTVDVPDNVLVHKDHLWLSFGTNVQNSGITTPFNWTALAGSAAFRLDAPVTAMLRQPGDQSTGLMSIATEQSTSMMYGSSAADFRLVPFEQSAGAKRYSAQRLGGQSVVFGNIGVFSMSATQAFGNFEPSSMTLNIRPFTQIRRNQCLASLVNKEKSQYRLFFNDGYGLYLTLVNGKLIGAMPVQFPNKAFCGWQADSPDGGEVSYFGSDNGFVYRLDSGTSHDGQPIVSYFTLTFANQGAARMLKRYRRATFEAQGDGYCDFSMTYEVGYGGGDRTQGGLPVAGVIALSSLYWDAFTWDSFTWDGRTLAPLTMPLDGTGENIAVRISSNSDLFTSLTFNSALIDYSPRRAMRSS